MGELAPTAENLALRPDGGETIFTLPNGLYGYFLYNNVAGGNRLDLGPAGIVFHRARGEEVFAASSCFSCHSRGVIPKNDEVRNVAITEKSLGNLSDMGHDLITNIYPEVPIFAKKIRESADSFERALATSRIFKLDTKSEHDILEMSDLYRGELNFAEIASECGLTEELLLQHLAELPDPIREHLIQARASGGISRKDFEQLYSSLIAALADLSVANAFQFTHQEVDLRRAFTDKLNYLIPKVPQGNLQSIMIEVASQGAALCPGAGRGWSKLKALLRRESDGETIELDFGCDQAKSLGHNSGAATVDKNSATQLIPGNAGGTWTLLLKTASPTDTNLLRKVRLVFTYGVELP